MYENDTDGEKDGDRGERYTCRWRKLETDRWRDRKRQIDREKESV
jgi:hypothetical protein